MSKYNKDWKSKKIAEIKQYKESDPLKYAEMYFKIAKGGKKNFFESEEYKKLKDKLDKKSELEKEKEKQRALKNPPQPYKPEFVKILNPEKLEEAKKTTKKYKQYLEIIKVVDFEKLKSFSETDDEKKVNNLKKKLIKHNIIW